MGSVVSNWEWQNIHTNEYPNVPFSMTALKPLFHRSIPIGGNGNTVAVSKYSVRKFLEDETFKSTHTSTYRQIIDYTSNNAKYSIESGQNGNLFGGHYFDMNKQHYSGSLYDIISNRDQVVAKSFEPIILKHLSENPHSTETFRPPKSHKEDSKTKEEI